jgi:hypothetical protein
MYAYIYINIYISIYICKFPRYIFIYIRNINIYIYIICVCYMFYVYNMLAGSGGKIGAPQCQVCHYSSLCFNLLISRGCSTFRDIPKKMYML